MVSGPEHSLPAQTTERGAALALFPLAATLAYYLLPASIQTQTLVQFAPQLLAYLALALWTARNTGIAPRLGLAPLDLRRGIRWGLLTGLLLGSLNTLVILKVVPALGYDMTFLKDTPHARIPLAIMVPWFICGIALLVETNFRGFLLGRLAVLESNLWTPSLAPWLSPLALLTSALVFAFDPFMVNTFRHLHWIALWDGMVWGIIWLRMRTLTITIVAHAVEVIVMYLAVRTALE